jgi:hypothetical protein
MIDGDSGDRRRALRQRLEQELGEAEIADEIVAALGDTVVDGLAERCGGDMAASPVLSYEPPTVADERIDSLWILAFGNRLAGGHPDATTVGEIPSMSDLEPGPTNEALAREAAGFTARFPVPIVAQWEVAHALRSLGVEDVISVEPDHAADGSAIYLSTAGVIEKGLRLAAESGIDVGLAGVLGHADHICRCVMTAERAGITAAVPEGVRLPVDYDDESAQPWTRSRADFVPVDLMARWLMD